MKSQPDSTADNIEQKVLDAVGSGNMTLEELALAVGKGKKVTVVQIDDDFRDTVWSMLDANKINLDWNLDIYRPDIGTRKDGRMTKVKRDLFHQNRG